MISPLFRSYHSALAPWIEIQGHEGAFAAIAEQRNQDLAKVTGSVQTFYGLAVQILRVYDLSDEKCHWAQLLIGSLYRCSCCDENPDSWAQLPYAGKCTGPAERAQFFADAKSDLAMLLTALNKVIPVTPFISSLPFSHSPALCHALLRSFALSHSCSPTPALLFSQSPALSLSALSLFCSVTLRSLTLSPPAFSLSHLLLSHTLTIPRSCFPSPLTPFPLLILSQQ